MSFSIVYKLKNDQSLETMMKINAFCRHLGFTMNDFTKKFNEVLDKDGHKDRYFYLCKHMYIKFLNELGYSSRVITEKFNIRTGLSEKCCYKTYKELFQNKKDPYLFDSYKFVEKTIKEFL